jgi:hypothetical protein
MIISQKIPLAITIGLLQCVVLVFIFETSDNAKSDTKRLWLEFCRA